jgi:hypothetical protein
MRSKRIVVPLWSDALAVIAVTLLMSACDGPASPPRAQLPNPPASKAKSSPPPPGTIRLSHAPLPANLQSEFSSSDGLPGYCARLDYSGPKTWLGFHPEGWHKGKRLSEGRGEHTIRVPLSGEIAFGLSELSGSEGKMGILIKESFPVESDSETHFVTHRFSTSTSFAIPSIKGRGLHTMRADLPLEIPDGKEVVIWAVFVDEPAGSETATLEDRASRADAAWLFKIRTVDEKK